ncbi:hypothetical protein ACHHYP_10728 [Achlya hypogyna]|uniref:LNR domain-containing protein n=1 Tax=Achlya hypogyna TaxID=1202772 RepID=A0A1V9ZHR1_ACHHY|nr:hypothetical protein ACHHYP_10728 [Achlya hypogyna]
MAQVGVQYGPTLLGPTLPPSALAKRRRRYVFSPTQRRLVLFCICCLHALTAFFLAALCFVYWVLPPSEEVVFGIYNRRVSLSTTTCLFFLHVHGMYLILWPHGPGRVSPETSAPQKRRFPWHHRWYRLVFSRYGPLGLYGPLYSVRVAAKLLCQLPMQVYTAYQMSCLLTTPASAFLCSFVLGLNCSVLPVLLHLPSAYARRWAPATFQAVTDFALSTGIPLALVLPAVTEYYILGDKSVSTDHVWLNRNVMLGRFIAMTSLFDVFAFSLFFFMCYFSLVTLNYGIRVRKGHQLEHRQSLALGMALSTRIETQGWAVRGIPILFYALALTTSAVLVGVAAASLWRRPCAPGCKLQTYPWFALDCTCIMYSLNCLQSPIDDIDVFIQTQLRDVFDLSVQQCHLPHGLAATTMRVLTNIYSLSLDTTSTIDWDISSEVMPPSLFAIYVSNMPMPWLPRALDHSVIKAQYVFLRNLSFSGNKTLGGWPDLTRLFANGLGLLELPTEARARTLTQVGLDNNALTELPIDVLGLPLLTSLSLINNSITRVVLASLPKVVRNVYLNGNPITTIDVPFELLRSYRLSLRDTPFCNRLLELGNTTPPVTKLTSIEAQVLAADLVGICGHECAIGCHAYQVGNGQCNPHCHTPACFFDKGDCTDYVF